MREFAFDVPVYFADFEADVGPVWREVLGEVVESVKGLESIPMVETAGGGNLDMLCDCWNDMNVR